MRKASNCNQNFRHGSSVIYLWGFLALLQANAGHLCKVTSIQIPCYAFLFEETILRSLSSQVYTPSLLSQQCDKESR